MSDRWLILGGTSSSASPRLPVLCGVPQGSVLGPTLWNLFYYSLLRIPIPDGAKLVAFTDDVALVVVAQNIELLEKLANPVLEGIVNWMTTNLT